MTRVVAVAGGKGGTGKTLVAASIAYLLSSRGFKILIVDADVDNPSISSLLRVEFTEVKEVTSFKPVIDGGRCTGCGECVRNCHENALALLPGGRVVLIESLCDGCGVCQLVCPVGAITEGRRVDGVVRYGREAGGADLIVGELAPGCRRTAALITRLIEDHKDVFKKYDYVVIDSPPGAGGSLYPIIRYADTVVAVTEPTPLGVSDLKKFLAMLEKYWQGRRQALVVINKYGLPSKSYRELEDLISEHGLRYVKIPYSDLVPASYVRRELIVATHPESEVSKSMNEIIRYIAAANNIPA